MGSTLRQLLGEDDDDGRRTARDFVARYDEGAPEDGISGEEALEHYGQVAPHLSPEEFEDVATRAFERMSPEQRQRFARLLLGHGDDVVPLADTDIDAEPSSLARLTSQVRQEQPVGLAGLFGGGAGGLGGMLGGLTGGQSFGGGTSGFGGMLGGLPGGGHRTGMQPGASGVGDLLNNPLARAALGGIAAMAMRRILGGR